MKSIQLIIILVLFSFQAISQKAEDLYKVGMAFQNEENYASAIENYTSALKVDARFYDAIYQRAYCNNRLQNYTQAKSDLLLLANKKAWKEKELVYFELGYCYDRLKQGDSANYYYQESTIANPNYPPPLKVIGKKLYYSKKYELARSFLAKYNGLTEGKDEDAQFWFAYGMCEREYESNDRALEFLSKSKTFFLQENTEGLEKLSPYSRALYAKVCYNLYECLILKNDIETAISNYETAISLDSTFDNNLTYWKNLGDSYHRKRDYLNAITYYKKRLDLNPSDADLLNRIAEIYHRDLKDYVNAIAYYDKIYKLNTNDLTYLTKIAGVYMTDLKDYNSAEKCYKQVLEKSQTDQNWVNLGALYVEAKKYDSAIEIFLKIKPIYLNWHEESTTFKNEEYCFANYYLAAIYVQKGDKEKALKHHALGVRLYGIGYNNISHSYDNLKVKIDKML